MLKRSLALLLALTLVLAAFAGCSKKEETISREDLTEPQILKYNYGADPETLDPGKASENVGFTVITNTFEGLTSLDDKDLPIPGVAEKWEISDDGTEYTFHLRDAKWSDGKPVTANDFAYAWKRVANPDTGADYSYQMFYLKNAEAIIHGEKSVDELGVEVIDEKTLKVTLEGPISWMLQMFAFPTYFPVRQDVVEANPDTWALEADTIISNGPFKVTGWTHSEEVVMERNEHYWDEESVLLDKFILTLINEDSTALSAFEAGDIDGTDGVPRSEIPNLLANNDDFEILPKLGYYYYTFNNQAAPFDNEKVRRAFALAIDRKAICVDVAQGGEKPAFGPVPYGLGINKDGKDLREVAGTYGLDPDGKAKVEEAQKLLADAGYPNGEGLPTIKLNYNTNEQHQKIAEVVQEMWKKNLNVNVELINQEWKVHLVTLEEGNYQVGRIGWLGDYSHPMTFIDLFLKASGNNYTQWYSDEYDELIRKTKSTIDNEEGLEYMIAAEKIFMERMTTAPIYYYTDPELVKSYVKNWRKSPLGYLYMNRAYIEGRE